MNCKDRILLVLIFSVAFLLTIPAFSQDYVISKNNKKYQVQDLTHLLSTQLKICFGEKILNDNDYLYYGNLAFSPSGRYLAFEISNTVWILDLQTKILRQILQRKFSKDIENIIWGAYWDEDNLFHIHYRKRYGYFLSSYIDYYLIVGKDYINTSQAPIINFDQSNDWNKYSSNYYNLKGEPYKIILTTKRNKNIAKVSFNDYDTRGLNVGWSNDGKKFLLAHNHGHGDCRLYFGYTKPKLGLIELGRAGWEIDNFSFSKNDHFLVFPHYGTIKIFDIKRLRVHDEIEFLGFVKNLSWSSKNQIAFILSERSGWRLKILQFNE